MRKLLIVLLLCILSVNLNYSQNGIGIYSITPVKESFKVLDSDDNLTKSTKKMLSNAFEIAKDFDIILKFNSSESISYIKEGVVNESIKNNRMYPIAIAMTGKGLFYQDKKNKIKLHQIESMGKKFLITDSYNNSWNITKETKMIGKYNCIKATANCDSCKNTAEVWFTNEISLNHGPLGYNGLPGLVIEVKTISSIIQLKNLKFDDNIKIDKPSKGQKISREKYNDLTKKIRGSY